MLLKRKILIIVIALILMILLLSFTFFRKSDINSYTVKQKKMVHSVYASGYIDSSDSVEVKSEVSGYIEKVIVKEGDEVKKGQLIATIHNETFKENIKDIEAQIASLEDRLNPHSDFRKELINSIEIKRVVLQNVERSFHRRKALFDEELISKERFDDIQRELEIARRDYERHVNIYNDSIKNLHYQLDSFRAKSKALKAELEKYQIKSPIDGNILRKFINPGDYINHIQQNNPLFSIGNEKNLQTVLLVDEEYIPMIKEGMKLYITLDSYPAETFEGKVITIERKSDRATRTVKVKADVRYNKNIFFGLTVESNIIIKEVEGFFIPESAYKNGYVEVLEGGKIKKVKVTASSDRYNGYRHITEGLKEGLEIVLK